MISAHPNSDWKYVHGALAINNIVLVLWKETPFKMSEEISGYLTHFEHCIRSAQHPLCINWLFIWDALEIARLYIDMIYYKKWNLCEMNQSKSIGQALWWQRLIQILQCLP